MVYNNPRGGRLYIYTEQLSAYCEAEGRRQKAESCHSRERMYSSAWPAYGRMGHAYSTLLDGDRWLWVPTPNFAPPSKLADRRLPGSKNRRIYSSFSLMNNNLGRQLFTAMTTEPAREAFSNHKRPNKPTVFRPCSRARAHLAAIPTVCILYILPR